ncbi:hypothetical protein Enr10x_46800 [Gimesia panareensis]|uniref:DUF1449 domain-containing protein n=1 Tax=Gimesia panareensis TaxID=2527978 RepID=A0A517QCH9_9PLAN|nr:hypothetical protein [Gimesia panareensis]QDT29328.1 hypothetical protein Enr10x_46800 [Gimesia panareensis]
MIELLHASLNWPTLPSTVLVAICVLYWLCVMVGALDIDILDFDLDLEVGGDKPSVLDFGFIGLRFLNLGEVPVMLWLSIFSLSMWALSVNFDAKVEIQSFVDYVPLFLRNLGISLVVVKLITQPFRGAFRYTPPNEIETLLGKSCHVTSSSVTEKYGQAELETEGAPLKLHIRSEDETIQKGDLVRLTDYNQETQAFYVVKINQES